MDKLTRNKKIIFGIKVKQLRQEKGLSFAELSERSGMSVSYLNEIEKGKKYPKQDKITALAKALSVEYDYLVSMDLNQSLAPLSLLLESKILDELPLDMFGIQYSKVVDIIANAPTKVGAFISAIMEIAKNYELEQERFYFAALRSYQELHSNYFEELEEAVSTFTKKQHLLYEGFIPVEELYFILERDYGYSIDSERIGHYNELEGIRSIFIPRHKNLLINAKLTATQKTFLLGREIAFNYLGLKERPYISSYVKARSFDQVLSNFKASYFSGALLLPRDSLVNDLSAFFKLKRWSSTSFLDILNKYQASPQLLLHRLTNLIPKYFGIQQLFLHQFSNDTTTSQYEMTKELHLNRQNSPYRNRLHEHYCRRWIGLWLLNDLKDYQEKGASIEPIVGVQRSRFLNTDQEYLCFTFALSGAPIPNTNISITIGLLVNERLKEVVQFLEDPAIPVRVVNKTCERCALQDCMERIVPPSIADQLAHKQLMQKRLKQLFNE